MCSPPDRRERSGPRRSRLTSWAFAAACILLNAACTVALQRDSDQCSTSADCQALAVGAICTSDGVCQALDESLVAKAESACIWDADCAEPWAICREGACRSLEVPGCELVGSPPPGRERLPIGVLVPSDELGQGALHGVLGAALTTVNELNLATATSSSPGVAAIACSDQDQEAIGALRRAGVVVFLGPSKMEALQQVRQTLKGGGIVFAPAADAPALLETESVSSVVSCKPNARDLLATDVSAVTFMRERLEQAGLIAPESAAVLAVSSGEKDLGYGMDAAREQQANIREVVYEYRDDGGDLTSQLKGTGTRLIVSASDEVDWSNNVRALDRTSRLAGVPPPFYLLKGKQLNALDAIQVEPMDLTDRRSVGRTSKLTEPEQQVRSEFAQSVRAATGNPASPDASYVHDCTYLAFYAAIAAQLRYSLTAHGLTPNAMLVGLRALVRGDAVAEVGREGVPGALALLERARGGDATLHLLGGSGSLELTELPAVEDAVLSAAGRYVRPVPGDYEFYCVEAAARRFCNTGVVIPAAGGPVSGENRCECFPF